MLMEPQLLQVATTANVTLQGVNVGYNLRSSCFNCWRTLMVITYVGGTAANHDGRAVMFRYNYVERFNLTP